MVYPSSRFGPERGDNVNRLLVGNYFPHLGNLVVSEETVDLVNGGDPEYEASLHQLLNSTLKMVIKQHRSLQLNHCFMIHKKRGIHPGGMIRKPNFKNILPRDYSSPRVALLHAHFAMWRFVASCHGTCIPWFYDLWHIC